MPAHVSLIIVNFHSAELAAEAIRTARAASRDPLQVVVVDNSTDAGEAAALRPLEDVLIAAESNLGYGAAINRARRRCDGELLIVSNPDVRFGSACIDRLGDSDADVAGPALFWDDEHSWFLPPAERHTPAQVLDLALASRSAAWRRARDHRRIRRRMAFWSLRRPTAVAALSGAVMAIRPAAFDRVGGFDERFHLYFEEIDFLRRVRTGILYVPDAQCRHLYNQSAASSDRAAAAYAESERAYLSKWGRFAPFAKRLQRPLPAGEAVLPLQGDRITIERTGIVVEASPLSSFDTAAGHFADPGALEIPEEVWDAYRGECLYLRLIDRGTASVMATFVRARIPS